MELLSAITSKLLNCLHKYLSLLDQEMQIKKETITDSQLVKAGDILLTSDLKHVIVKHVCDINTTKRKDRISLEILHASNHFILSKTVSKSTFALIPQTSVVAVRTKHNRCEKETSFEQEALRNVENVLLPRSKDSYELLLSFSDLLAPMMHRRQTYASTDLNPGDLIVFQNHGSLQKGVILSKQEAHNHLLKVRVYYIDECGCVSETDVVYDLDEEIVTRYAYNDLDFVIRKRVLYAAEQMKGICLYRGVVQKSLRFVFDCMSGDIAYKQHQHIFIGYRETKLKTSACPRIENIERWMKCKTCDDLPETLKGKVPALQLCPTIIVLNTTDGESEPASLFQDKHIMKTKVETFSSPSRAKERMLQRCSVSQTKTESIFFVCMLSTDEMGDLTKQDAILIDLLKDITTTDNILYVIPQSSNIEKRRMVSNAIKTQLKDATLTNGIYHSVFFDKETGIEKRITLFAEQQVYNTIRELNRKMRIMNTETPLNGKEADSDIAEYKKKMEKLESCFPSDKPDYFACHKLEVLLQRHSDVSAFSMKDGGMQIFTTEEEHVRSYIEQCSPKTICDFSIKSWPGLPKVSKYHLKQGSKVNSSSDHSRGYGTLGFFLRDSKGSIYFTTCAHVIPKKREVFTDTIEAAVGESVFATDLSKNSISESLDLSLVKVFEEKIENCRYRLRDSTDNLVTGMISPANESEMNNMKVYKWGAKTKLTKGTYKGSIYVKEGEEFKSRIHLLKGNPEETEFAVEGDSGSLICFEATDSLQLSCESAAFIFVGKCSNNQEYFPEEYRGEEFFEAYGYHVKDVFTCEIPNLNPMFTPCNEEGSVQQGAGIQF
ncbi:uncharacterized protein LOC143058887 [Mytilus galloprovincialis]|uniref:uncharacterized protein LOC143058887 n=1 Tax=Mytilus galloprovincialis TaxID=29158 RepID=UPI003F7C2C8C